MNREEAIKFAEYAQIMADGKPDVQEFYKLAESALRQQEHFREVTKKVEPMTNADRIRAMSDEELAEFIKHIKVRAAFCKAVKDNDAFEALCSAEWLQMPAEEDDHGHES